MHYCHCSSPCCCHYHCPCHLGIIVANVVALVIAIVFVIAIVMALAIIIAMIGAPSIHKEEHCVVCCIERKQIQKDCLGLVVTGLRRRVLILHGGKDCKPNEENKKNIHPMMLPNDPRGDGHEACQDTVHSITQGELLLLGRQSQQQHTIAIAITITIATD
ncbi:hypothetical protein QOT17_018660 [Balamuthia mandrillaris]